MKITLSYVYITNSPKDWKTRMKFYFSEADRVEISDYNKFGNQEVIVYSKLFPKITYEDGNCFKCRYATEEEVEEYCQVSGNKFSFTQVQKDCVKLGAGIWD